MNIFKHQIKNCRFHSCYNVDDVTLFRRNYASKKSRKAELATVKALNHFDDLYGGIFQKKWHSIRLGLLSQPKHVALINNFGHFDETKEVLKRTGAINLRKLLTPSDIDLLGVQEEIDLGKTAIKHNRKATEEKEIIESIYSKEQSKNVDSILKYDKTESSGVNASDPNVSLHEALQQSEIDSTRLIDPSLGLDSNSLHEFVPVTALKGKEDYIPETDYYRFYQVRSDLPVNIEKEDNLLFPENLTVYSYPRGDISVFPHPKMCANNLMNYYTLDGASILVVLALGLEPGDHVLDMCAAPGGKSLAILQTMLPERVVCNDSSISRSNRLVRVLQQYLHDFPDRWKNVLSLRRLKGESINDFGAYNKILVDVPCMCDRHSATVDENNIFKTARTKERLSLPQNQSHLLEQAMKLVKPGGTVVYSTCTLSPVQNDGVVNMALQRLYMNYKMEFTIKDLNPALKAMSHFYKFSFDAGLKYGSLVVPFVPVNFGPILWNVSKMVHQKTCD